MQHKCILLAVSALLPALPIFGCKGSGGHSPPPTPPPPALVGLEQVATGLIAPLDLQVPPDGSGRLFVVEQAGKIRIVAGGAVLPAAFLDIQGKVISGGELGLLGLAFHPGYGANRRFFVHYNRNPGSGIQSAIAEYRASAADPDLADPTTERILLTVDQPFPNHKGGQLTFGNDGFLYIGLGDGGSAGDPQGNGQKLGTLLGKLLRIDVDAADPGKEYAIPPDNPFAAGGGLPEIWAYGFRNPWRFSFDRPTGRLFCGDVGQDLYEEVDIVVKGGNHGWNILEGFHCFHPPAGCSGAGTVLPIAEYDHSEGESITGGHVYRGAALPSLAGDYIFGDFISGSIWALREDPPGTWTRTLLASTGRRISSFGQDEDGEVYVVDYGGNVLRLGPP